MTGHAIVSYFLCSQTFSIFTQYMSVSHGYSTIGGIEYGGVIRLQRIYNFLLFHAIILPILDVYGLH